jgi:hypothetical protein
MTPNEFFQKYNNKPLDFDGSNGAQCVDVAKAFFKEVLGIEPIKGNAIDYWKDIPGFQRIKSGMLRVPKPYDIIIWDKTPTNPYGHIAICNWVRMFDFGSFDQNWPVGSPCHFQDHIYPGVLGWLRPLSLVDAPRPSPVPQGPWHVPLTILGSDIPNLPQEVLKWSGGSVILDVKFVPMNLPYSPTFDYATLAQDRFCIISCNPAPEIYRTSLTDNLKTAYAVAGPDALTASYEVSHILTKYYLAHRGSNPYFDIEDTVGQVTDEQRYRKYNVVKPYMDSVILKP